MIKIKILVVGKIKEQYYEDAVLEYLKRLKRYAEVKVVEIKEENFVNEPSVTEREVILKKESVGLIKELKGNVYSLAIEGKKYNSVSFAKLIGESVNEGKEITFVIGGSYGLDSEVKNKSKGLISFSDMTFPHTLARVILVEQIYRAFTILSEGKYHK